MGEKLNGYLLQGKFQNKNAGFSKWTYGSKDEKNYFIKEFIDPIYPMGDTISEKMKAVRIEECEKSEKRNIRLYGAVNGASDGNLVRIEEYFRVGAHYYIAMQKIEEEEVSFEELQECTLSERAFVCRVVAHAMMRLHEQKVIHSDIKDTNVLLHRTKNGKLTAKIIDFDCGFFEGEPPESGEELGGDQVYLSPEGCMFLCDEEVDLTCKMDVFSMGLLFHQYLTGELPGFDNTQYDYAHEAVLDEQELEIDKSLPEELKKMLKNMLCADAKSRWSSRQVNAALGEYLYNEEEMPEADTPQVIDLGKYYSEEMISEEDGNRTRLLFPDEKDAANGNKWFHSAGNLKGRG